MARFSNRNRERIFKAGALGGLAFAVLTFLAMLAFPGGTRNNPETPRYYFTQNYFSDLGRTRDFEGNWNLTSMVLFSVALGTVGVSTAAFFMAMPDVFDDSKTTAIVSTIMTGFGLLAGVGFLGIASTPWDHFARAHNLFVDIGFDSLLVACLAAMVNVYRTRSFPNRYGHLMVGVSTVLLGYILLLKYGPSPDTSLGLIVQVGGQKVVAYVLVGGITALAFGAIRVAQRDKVQVTGPTSES